MVKFIRKRATAERVGYHPTWVMRLAAQGKFPTPVQLGDNSIAFVEDEVTAWQKAKIAARDAALANAKTLADGVDVGTHDDDVDNDESDDEPDDEP